MSKDMRERCANRLVEVNGKRPFKCVCVCNFLCLSSLMPHAVELNTFHQMLNY
jgi:hypothetical protein